MQIFVETELTDAVNVWIDIGSVLKKSSSRINKSNSNTNVLYKCLNYHRVCAE
jgi:hypothetical protein